MAEAAVVIVILGILLSMVFRMESIVTVAKVKAEISKLNKFEVAVRQYVLITNGALPLGNTSDYISENIFTDRGLLSTGDFKSDFIRRQSYDTTITWTLRGGYIPANTDGSGQWTQSAIERRIGARLDNMSPILACNIENILDDKNVAAGQGRIEGAIIYENKYFDDCYSNELIEDKAPAPYTYIVYEAGAIR